MLLLEQSKILANTLSKKFKLLNKEDFSNLKEKPLFYKSSFFLFFYKKNSLSNSRLGISITKKTGNAVFRNKTKRIIREIYRTNEFKNLNFDLNLVLNAKKVTKKSNHNLDFKTIEKDLIQAFNFITNQ